MKVSDFYKNTFILVLSNIITGTLNFIFSIILSRQIGPKGMGIYQLVMPLYTMFLFITGGGITIAVSKVAAEKKAKRKLNELYKTVNTIILFEIFWSIIITAILLSLSKQFSLFILKDSRTYYSILAFTPALIIVSISSVYKGAFYGIQRMIEPALIDIVEKIIRILVMFPLINFFKSKSLELSCASAMLALSAGEFTSLLLFYIFYQNYKLKNKSFDKAENSIQLLVDTLKLSLPLAINGISSTIFSMFIAILIPKRLMVAGFSYEDAISMFGKLSGMALNVIFYPAVILNSLSIVLIPSISEFLVLKNFAAVKRRIKKTIEIALILSLSTFIILNSIPDKISLLFYKDISIAPLIKTLSYGLAIIYVEMISFSILNALGRQTQIMINSLILSIIDIVIIYIFIAVPRLNIYGYAINFIVSATVGIILNFIYINLSVKLNFEIKRDILVHLLTFSVCLFLSWILLKSGITPITYIFSIYIVYLIIFKTFYKFLSI
ncbi:stage V sporulation protein B [Caloramator australicus]|uniref:Stage V sporulation protein B n=1 Tax=Caloramator australicus RC3 TaxID=857293 RepID=I7LID4_9CLOT|nr:stage V sporulation protein B [Caloramator australicus]CCJ34788.1 Stage V sporulation protein B [Caloramator australicus RC3]